MLVIRLLVLVLMFSVALSAVEQTWHVDPVQGDDEAAGDQRSPLATIGEALTRVRRSSGPATVSLAAGTYREGGLTLHRRDGRVTITCPKGVAVITGADIWTDWAQRDGHLVARWPYDWGANTIESYPEGERSHLHARGTRCEMVFVDGALLMQVTERTELFPGTYLVDEEVDELIVVLPEGVDPEQATLEVSVRGNLLQAHRVQGLTLRNLVFTQAANGAQREGNDRWGVFIAGEHAGGDTDTAPDREFARDIVIEDCRFEWNNSSGMTIANVIGLRVERSQFDNNGVSGIGANRLRDVIYRNCTFNGNNWRLGLWGGVYGWAPAGTKHLFMADALFESCLVDGNHATGLWLDFGHERVVVRDCVITENAGPGVYVEASAGPVSVEDCRIERNAYQPRVFPDAGGVLMAESMQVTIDGCTIRDNLHYQIGVRSRERPSSGYWSGTTFDGHCHDLQVIRSTLVGGVVYVGDNVPEWYAQPSGTASLIGRQIHAEEASYQAFLASYQARRNTYGHRVTEEAFATGEAYGTKRIALAAWQDRTGQDRGSRWIAVAQTPAIGIRLEQCHHALEQADAPVAVMPNVDLVVPYRAMLVQLEIVPSNPEAGDRWTVLQANAELTVTTLPAAKGIRITGSAAVAVWRDVLRSVHFATDGKAGIRRANIRIMVRGRDGVAGGSLVNTCGEPLRLEVVAP